MSAPVDTGETTADLISPAALLCEPSPEELLFDARMLLRGAIDRIERMPADADTAFALGALGLVLRSMEEQATAMLEEDAA